MDMDKVTVVLCSDMAMSKNCDKPSPMLCTMRIDISYRITYNFHNFQHHEEVIKHKRCKLTCFFVE